MNDEKTTKTTKRITVHLDQDASDVFESILRQIDSPMMPANRTALASVLMQSGCKALESQATAEGKPLRDVLDAFARSALQKAPTVAEQPVTTPVTEQDLRMLTSRLWMAAQRLLPNPENIVVALDDDWRLMRRKDVYTTVFRFTNLVLFDHCPSIHVGSFLRSLFDMMAHENNEDLRLIVASYILLYQCFEHRLKSTFDRCLESLSRYEAMAGFSTVDAAPLPDYREPAPEHVSRSMVEAVMDRLCALVKKSLGESSSDWHEAALALTHLRMYEPALQQDSWPRRDVVRISLPAHFGDRLDNYHRSELSRLACCALIKICACERARSDYGSVHRECRSLYAEASHWMDQCEQYLQQHPIQPEPSRSVADAPAAAPAVTVDSTATPPVTDAPAMKPVKASREPLSAAGKAKKGKTR